MHTIFLVRSCHAVVSTAIYEFTTSNKSLHLHSDRERKTASGHASALPANSPQLANITKLPNDDLMVSKPFMLLLISSAGIRRALFTSGPLFSNAFLTHAPHTPPSASPAAACRRRQIISPRFMSTDAVAGDKTDEEKAAIKEARKARK